MPCLCVSLYPVGGKASVAGATRNQDFALGRWIGVYVGRPPLTRRHGSSPVGGRQLLAGRAARGAALVGVLAPSRTHEVQ